MGYQDGNDNTGIDSNKNNNAKSVGRTSKTEELCNSTTKAQYKRLTDGGLPVVGSGKAVGTGTI